MSTARYAGSALFRALARRLAEELNLRLCFIAEFREKPGAIDQSTFKTLAHWVDDHFLPDSQFNMAGSVGEPVIRGRRCYQTVTAPRDFPTDKLVAETGGSLLFAVPLLNGRGEAMGILVGGVNAAAKPAAEENSNRNLQTCLERVAVRAAVELEQIRAERSSEFNESWFRAVIESGPDLTAVVHPDGQLHFMTRSWEQSIGHRPDDLIGDSIFRMIHPEDHFRVRNWLSELSLGRASLTAVVGRVRHREGHWLEFEWHGSVLSDTSVCRQIVIRLRKIASAGVPGHPPSHQQRLEYLGTVVGHVAHDFRNLLTPVLTYARTARLSLPDNHPLQSHLDAIIRSAVQADQLTSQILLFVHPESSARPAPLPVCLPNIVADALPLLRASIPKAIELRSQLASDIPAIKADTGEIHQVLLNLCVNAADALEQTKGARIEIATRLVTVESGVAQPAIGLVPGTYVLLSVEDNGCGMDEHTQRRAFEPFFTTKLPGHGTGLGLAGVRDIAQRHSAVIRVQSEPGQGTKIGIYFPVNVVGSTGTRVAGGEGGEHRSRPGLITTRITDPDEASPVTLLQGVRLLLVEDEEPLLFLLKRALTQCGATVTGFSTAKAALECFRASQTSFDAVLTDLNMRDMNGPELAMAIRQLDEKIRIAVITGYCSETMTRQIESIANTVVIDKCVDPVEFGQTVAAALGRVL